MAGARARAPAKIPANLRILVSLYRLSLFRARARRDFRARFIKRIKLLVAALVRNGVLKF